MSTDRPVPIQRGFEYEVRLAVSIPIGWARLLKDAAKHHYDHRCNEAGRHGVVNGLYNTAQGGPLESTLAVTWRDLDLVTKVAEQLEHHTSDHEMIRSIRSWLQQTKSTIAQQHQACGVSDKMHEYRAAVEKWLNVQKVWREHDYVGLLGELYSDDCVTGGGELLKKIEILVRSLNNAMEGGI